MLVASVVAAATAASVVVEAASTVVLLLSLLLPPLALPLLASVFGFLESDLFLFLGEEDWEGERVSEV